VGDVLGQLADRCPNRVPLREALLKPLRPGGRVVVFSSGAAANPNGSPLSGGYAGAKATQRFITGYAQDEAERAGLDITFTAVLPQFAPQTGVGGPAVQAYAARAEQPLEEYLPQVGPFVTPEIAGTALVELVLADAATVAPGYRLTAAGLEELPWPSPRHEQRRRAASWPSPGAPYLASPAARLTSVARVREPTRAR
jgi:NAD(P)-dependent dehydrogenase (short-subunit alcohol dehydrogenase family)